MSGTTKTVAERLRDYAEGNPGFCGEFRKITMGVRGCADLTCTECRQQMLHALADAIEAEQAELRKQSGVDVDALKFCADHLDKIEHGDIADTVRAAFEGETYELFKQAPQLPEGIEWPRFEDGELVRIGDEFQHDGETKDITRVLFYETRTWLRAKTETCYREYEYLPSKPLKRPEPEVLDADGVPIKVGDTVWYADKLALPPDMSFKVFHIEASHNSTKVYFKNGGWAYPEVLTHRKPDTFKSVVEEMLTDFDSHDTIELDGYFDRLRKLLGGE